MSMIEAAISRLESLAAACEDNAAIEANEGKSELADNNLRNAASYREAIKRLQAPEEQAPEQPLQIPQRTPQIGDQVVYHPRPIDRVRKPENYNGLVSHTAFVAHAHDQIFYNLMVIDSGGVPYPVSNIIFRPPGYNISDEERSFGGWFEFSLDKEGN